jgi:tRNA pseudouridine38/39 synthase
MLLRCPFECCQSLSCQAPKWRKIPFISYSFIQVHRGFLFESDGTGRDMSDYATRHIALKLMYLGSRYHGFASQAESQRTVEAEVFAALERTRLVVGPIADAHYTR